MSATLSFRKKGIITIAVGVGSGHSRQTLFEIAQNVSDNVFEVTNFKNLMSITEGLFKVIDTSATGKFYSVVYNIALLSQKTLKFFIRIFFIY